MSDKFLVIVRKDGRIVTRKKFKTMEQASIEADRLDIRLDHSFDIEIVSKEKNKDNILTA